MLRLVKPMRLLQLVLLLRCQRLLQKQLLILDLLQVVMNHQ